MSNNLAIYLKETYFFDWSHPNIQEKVKTLTNQGQSNQEKAVAIYYGIRDSIRYNPYNIYSKPHSFKSSKIANRIEGHCIDKGALMVACCRAVGIPARIGFAKVRNHIGTEKLEEKLGTNILVPHGYVEVHLDHQWVKATPAFNKQLCDILKVKPLDFNGMEDSIFQEYDREGGNFMEYLEDYGTFEDLPLNFILNKIKEYYPRWEVIKEEATT